jgi:hypothetical protein
MKRPALAFITLALTLALSTPGELLADNNAYS